MVSLLPSASEALPAAWYAAAAMADDASDGELVRRIGAGGAAAREAEGALCRRFAPRIRAYGRRHLRDDERANDLVQAVLLGVLEAARAGRVQDLHKVDRFVLGTCRNTLLRARERDARLRPVATHDLPEIAIDPPEPVDVAALMRCLAALDDRARRVVWLSFNEERSAEEIAGELAMTAGNVRVARHRAVQALRRCLDGGGPSRREPMP